MNKNIFTVYDCKGDSYLKPFVMRTVNEAIRAFETTANDPQSGISQHPEDYTLFHIGTWNELKGEVQPLKAHAALAKAVDLKKDKLQQPQLQE